jgi:hypothetical protein
MANEATLVFETGRAIPFTVADGNAITKGSICKLTDPFTASITSAANDLIAGIANGDKIASDGVTTLGMYREGIFRMYASGSISVGDPVVTTTPANYVKTALGVSGVSLSGSKIIGKALQTVTTGQQLLVDVHIETSTGTA